MSVITAKYILRVLEDSSQKSLDLKPLGTIGNTFFVMINGRKYGYEPQPQTKMTADQLEKEFLSRIKLLGRGVALKWLKDPQITKLVSGSVKGIPVVARGTAYEYQ